MTDWSVEYSLKDNVKCWSIPWRCTGRSLLTVFIHSCYLHTDVPAEMAWWLDNIYKWSTRRCSEIVTYVEENSVIFSLIQMHCQQQGHVDGNTLLWQNLKFLTGDASWHRLSCIMAEKTAVAVIVYPQTRPFGINLDWRKITLMMWTTLLPLR